jgi:hypothetical protein
MGMNLDRLSGLLCACPYPEQMEYIERGILGSGFYPGAQGFPDALPADGGILLLGRDFGAKNYYKRLCGTPAQDETALTWRKTRDIYLACFSGLPVWCTNYLLGVRRDGSSVGNIRDLVSASDWISFEEYCWGFLQAQVLLQRPRLIIIFGGDNRTDLTSEERFGYVSDDGIRHSFTDGEDEHSALVKLEDHPSYLRSRDTQAAARVIAEQLKEIYQREAQEDPLKPELPISASSASSTSKSMIVHGTNGYSNASANRRRRGNSLHFQFEQAFHSRVGQVLSKREIGDLLQAMFPNFPDGSVVPTDHAEPSLDHVNQCRKCASSEFRIFDTAVQGYRRPGIGRYRVRDFVASSR